MRFGAEAYARRASATHAGINPLKGQRRGPRSLRQPIVLHTPLPTVPDRHSRDSLGLRASCSRRSCRGSFLVVLPGKEQAVLAECSGVLVGRFFPVHALSYEFHYIRRSVLRVEQTAVLISAEHSTATNLTQHGPLSDLSRSAAFHCVMKLQPPSCPQRYQLQCSRMGSLSIHAICRRMSAL